MPGAPPRRAGFSRQVALKMIHPNLVAQPGLIEMLSTKPGSVPRSATIKLDALAPALRDFNFSVYGRPISQVWVHRDGYISFGRDNPEPNGDRDPGALGRGSRTPAPNPHRAP